jgi:glycosidase
MFKNKLVGFKRGIAAILIGLLVLAAAPLSALASDFQRETIYQIITDRFVDGDPSNNNPPQSAGLYDSTQTNWRFYWGGDLAGIQQKMSYLAGMGVTAIWISPPVDNLNTTIPGSPPQTGYHGYQARDFKRIEEHFGDVNNLWTEFDNLVAAAHRNGIKVIVDFAPNHSNQDNAGEFGALYDNGALLAKFTDDPNGYFHHNPDISDFNDRYQLQYYTLFDLADLNQENSTIDAYLKTAAQMFQQHGVDAFRIDAVKHTNWGWEYSLANSIYSFGDSFMFGEWAQGGTGDPLYHDSFKFANHSGISLLDFPLNTAIRDVLGPANAGFGEIDSTITQEGNDFSWKDDLVTFIDSHDMPRFLSIENNQNRLHEALSFLLTARGIPCVYYGTEQYIHNDTGGGGDPYNRNQMTGFSTSTVAYGLIKKLSDLRKTNPAIAYGSMGQRWINNDVYIYERKFFGSVVLVAINKNDSTGYAINGLNTALPPGNYSDYLGGLLSGPSISVSAGGVGNNPVTGFNLPAHSVSVWSAIDGSAAPEVGSIGPTVGQPGIKVTIGGQNFGGASGTVKYGNTLASVVSWSPTKVVVTAPSLPNGNTSATVTNALGQVSNGIQFTVLTSKLVPVTFAVNNATPTNPGDYIFLTGNTIELGNWSTTWDGAIGPMLAPNYPNWFLCVSVPAGQTIQFKFMKLAANGTVTMEGGADHTYTVPTSGTGSVNVTWQN